MKKTLMIVPNYPQPENNGSNMRTMNFVRYFEKYGEVDILCKQCEVKYHDTQNSYFTNRYFFDWSVNKLDSKNCLERIYDKLVRLKSWSTSHYTMENEQTIRTIVREGNYDFIVCRYLSQAYPLIDLDPDLRRRVILDVDDIVTESIYDTETRNLTGIGRLASAINKCIIKIYQERCLGFGTILFCSEADRLKAVRPALLSKSFTVPNVSPGMVLPDGYRNNGYDSVNHLLFVGSLGYTPNYQGLTWFITEVLPHITRKFSDLKFSVIGKNPPYELSELVRRHPEIELCPNVADIVPFYERCGISVVPLLAGGGTRIKILESGFAKRPVISTEIGAYGLGMNDEEEVMIFKDSKSFLEKYIKMREDRELYDAMTDRLSRFVGRNFSYENFCKAMDAVVRRLLNSTFAVDKNM